MYTLHESEHVGEASLLLRSEAYGARRGEMGVESLGVAVALVTFVITIPSTVVAIQQYRGRPLLEPRLFVGDHLRITLINVADQPASGVTYELALRQADELLWRANGIVDFLGPGSSVELDCSILNTLRRELVDILPILELRSRQASGRWPLRSPSRTRVWGMFDPRVCRLE